MARLTHLRPVWEVAIGAAVAIFGALLVLAHMASGGRGRACRQAAAAGLRPSHPGRATAMISHFFIDRPIFASVLSIVFVLAGGVAVFTLPVAAVPRRDAAHRAGDGPLPRRQCPDRARHRGRPHRGAGQRRRGHDLHVLAVHQRRRYTLTVTFKLGMDSDMAQVLVQNRVSLALPVIPPLVQTEGINVQKMSPSTLMIVNLISPDQRYNSLFLSNYATIYIKDELSRLPGVAGITYLGQRDYSLRAWLDPDKLAALNLDAMDVVTAISQQNLQVAAGQIGQQPAPKGQQFQLTINTLGRLTTPEQFGDIILKAAQGNPLVQPSPTGLTGHGGWPGDRPRATAPDRQRSIGAQATGIVRLRDVVTRTPTGARVSSWGRSSTSSPARSTASRRWPCRSTSCPAPTPWTPPRGVYAKMDELKTRFPEGLDYQIVYDTTPFIRESIDEVFQTLRDAMILVAIVVLVFLQNWRAALIPLVAVPVAIVGTFAVMAALGYSLNNLSLFGLVLAIGIVVDDAIVVVENVERWLEQGLRPAGGGAQGHGRGDRAGDRGGPGAVRRVRAVRLPQRHHRPVLPPVRRDHRRLDGDLGLQLADAQPGPGGHPAQAARRPPRPTDLAAGHCCWAGSSGCSTGSSAPARPCTCGWWAACCASA